MLLLLQAERLADYGRILGGSQPHLDGRRRDLDRIQDLFPHDFLGLHHPEPNSTYNVVSNTIRNVVVHWKFLIFIKY